MLEPASAKRRQVSLDLPPLLIDHVHEIAAELQAAHPKLSVTDSVVAQTLMGAGLRYGGGQVDKLLDYELRPGCDWDAARVKASYRLPPALVDVLDEYALHMALACLGGAGVGVSDVAVTLLGVGIDRYQAGDVQYSKPQT
jgi:hypothetical protein